ncbi:ZIP family metal transporter [Halococcoides cellulosivorans]|uniref:ZIP family metal transporter n=1 Tax=Halococcoides cellulosivorans TaxID=1679096 RepID=A0A2R4WXN3_9EURY|nr:ZIP family metal transporter [Halococcoides cellulosivorans]AWB26271.1 ZIP family metal transporter [Halococcoides cellulosivorans]
MHDDSTRLATGVSVLTAIAFAAVLAVGLWGGRTTLVGVVAFGFVAMVAGVAISVVGEFDRPRRQIWAYGLASGAMLASAAALLAPKAIAPQGAFATQTATYGGFAIAAGYLLGYAGHELGHLLTHHDLPLNATVSELTVHALAAGTIMGVVYGSLPGLSALFGFGVLAHKFPAGFTGSESLRTAGLPRTVMVVPAAAVALAAIPVSLVMPDLSEVVQAIFYGVSTGVFAHVAVDMLPECSHVGSHSESGHGSVECSRDADRLRRHAVASTVAGAGAIVALWHVAAMV